MTDIENKAIEYAQKEFFNANRSLIGNNGPLIAEALEAGFDAGAAYALSNQWRDAEKEKPEDEQEVLILTTYIGTNSGEPRTLIEQFTYFEQYGFWLKEKSERRLKLKVLAWMEIPEYKPKNK